MPWGTWSLGSQTTIYFGKGASGGYRGIAIEATMGPDVLSVLSSPMTSHLLEIRETRLSAVGAAADFPVLPKWRKVTRQIG